MIRAPDVATVDTAGLPRMCGDDPMLKTAATIVTLFAPHVRG